MFRKMGLSFLRLLPALLLLTVSFHPVPAEASSFQSKTAPDGRKYKLFIPGSYQTGKPAPLIVMLHGCTQDPDNFAAGTQMNAWAEQRGYLIAYPAQTTSANASRCWNWFETAHQQRDQGEPASIAGVVRHIQSQYSVDSSRVYAAGLSAGGAMSVIMGATYPDVFTAIGVHSGLEYKAATSSFYAWWAMMYGGPDPNRQGTLAYQVMGDRARVVPVILFHGTSDYTVRPVNGDQVIAQWAQTNDWAWDGADNDTITATPADTVRETLPGGRTYDRKRYTDPNSRVIMEYYSVQGMGHAWSGGSTQGSYTDPAGPDATGLMGAFFSRYAK